MIVPLVGAKTRPQLESIPAVFDVELTPEERIRLEDVNKIRTPFTLNMLESITAPNLVTHRPDER